MNVVLKVTRFFAKKEHKISSQFLLCGGGDSDICDIFYSRDTSKKNIRETLKKDETSRTKKDRQTRSTPSFVTRRRRRQRRQRRRRRQTRGKDDFDFPPTMMMITLALLLLRVQLRPKPRRRRRRTRRRWVLILRSTHHLVFFSRSLSSSSSRYGRQKVS